jgi:hypothetical protein
MKVVTIVAVLLLFCCIANMVGWAIVRRWSTPIKDGPFNWRIFLGPWVYGKWVDRQ